MNYSPKQLRIWDAWCMPVGDEVHLYHLQRNRPGADLPAGVQDTIGHAVSRNLVDWEERPPAFEPDPNNPNDDLQPWTGCALWHDGRGYFYYTMRGSRTASRVQSIGLATTQNPDHWTRYPENPVIVPDSHWYATVQEPAGIVDCRDLLVVPDPAGTGWYGFYAARQPGEELPETSVIACVHSRDMFHWEHLPPAFAPRKYACIEVPDVFMLNGRWYLTCLTGNFYGNRGIFSDPNIDGGTIFAVADRPQGPYTELDENLLLGARTTSPISLRSVAFQGERYVLYTDREREDGNDNTGIAHGTISTPKVLRTDGDRLYAAYSARIESRVVAEVITPNIPPQPVEDLRWMCWPHRTARWTRDQQITGESRTGWSIAIFEHAVESFIYEANITLHDQGAAGLAMRIEGAQRGAAVILDAKEQSITYAEVPSFVCFYEKRMTPIPVGTPLHLRVVNRLEHIEVYLNDELRLAFSRYAGLGGRVGLFIDRGHATFADIRLRTLRVEQPLCPSTRES